MVAGLPQMKANTAVCFALMGAGVVLLSRTHDAARVRSVGYACIGLAGSIALATGVEQVTGVKLSVAELLQDSAVWFAAGQMSPSTRCASRTRRRCVRGAGCVVVIALSGAALALSPSSADSGSRAVPGSAGHSTGPNTAGDGLLAWACGVDP